MIAKVEIEVEPTSADGPWPSVWHGYDTYRSVSRVTKSRLEDFNIEHQLLPETVLKTAWALLLRTYRGVSSVQFGVADAGVSDTTKELYISFEEQESLLALCRQVDSSTPAQDASQGLCNTVVVSGGYVEKAFLSVTPSKANSQASNLSQFELAVATQLDGEELILSLFYNSEKVSKPSAIGYWHTLEKVLDTLLQDYNQTLHQADFLSDHDRNQLVGWNQPPPEKPEDLTICSVFAAHVERQPQAPAVYAWDGEMNYNELDEVSARVAAELVAFGVSSGSIVPFCMEKTKWALVAALSILKTGAALVPMDPAWPQQRTTTILDATEASIVVCSSETISCFDGMNIRTFELTTTTFQSMQILQTAPVGPLTRDVAFILFSSGSTGVPKGMVREHGTACIASIAHAKAMHIDQNSRVLQFANHVFDVAMLDFFTTLVAGGSVCIPSEFERKNDLAGFIQRSQANWALLTPTVASMLDPLTVPSLCDMTMGGEAITTELLNKWLGHTRVGINYGSAEVDVTQARDVEDTRDPANVGKRLPCCVTYIVDPDNVKKILPIGAVGELLISGPTMARSYLKNPEKTAASFIEAPVDWYLKDSDGNIKSWMKRAYRMGDLLQQQWDGSFRFVGRRDFQVKIHGQKVELGEIEAQLSTHKQVYRCAVVYPHAGPFAERLVAVIEPRGSTVETRRRGNTSSKMASELGVEDVKSYLSERVPSYMLPQVVILANPMPLTATMKVDRTKLKSWITENDPLVVSSQALASISTALKGPVLQAGERLALQISDMIADLVAPKTSQIWSAIQGHDNVLADIGIDSVQTMRLSNSISKVFDTKVPVEILTDKQLTVRRLAELISAKSAVTSDTTDGKVTSEMLRKKIEEALSKVSKFRAKDGAKPTTTTSNGVDNHELSTRNVLLTGATGYLGIQILRALLESANVGNVHILVRSAEVSRARARIASTALAANWSIEPFGHRIKIWLGDLSQPQLGLQDSDWMQLGQHRDIQGRIDSIVHCGAVVDWTKSYDALETANVTSTIQLLNMALESHSVSRFLYISGGQYFQPGSDEGRLDDLFEEAAAGNGYAQTKFVAEQLVNAVQKQFSRARDQLQIDTVKPAYLIGSKGDGLANIDDYLWRLVATATQIQVYNQDESAEWLLAADASCVANKIVEIATKSTTDLPSADVNTSETACIKILDGISVDRFWTVVGEETGRTLNGVSGSEWRTRVTNAMECDTTHVLWPLLEAFDKGAGQLTGMKLPAAAMQGPDSKDRLAIIEEAVRRNVRYLADIGFLPSLL